MTGGEGASDADEAMDADGTRDGDGTTDSDAMPEALRVESDADVDSDTEFEPDRERRELLREVAEDVRGDTSESRQLSAVLYRVSDLYDPDEDTSPEEIYLNVRHIMDIKAKGGLRTD